MMIKVYGNQPRNKMKTASHNQQIDTIPAFTDADEFLSYLTGRPKPPEKIKKPTRKNYAQENAKRIKEIQTKNKDVVNKDSSSKNLWKDVKYNWVPSKVAVLMRPSSSATSLSTATTTLKNVSGNIKQSKSNFSSLKLPSLAHSKSLSSIKSHASTEEDLNLTKTEKDFGASNIAAANNSLQSSSSACTSLKKNPSYSHKKGSVPKYLLERKQQLQEEKLHKESLSRTSTVNKQNMLSDEKRNYTLTILQQRQKELVQMLNKMSLYSDTLRTRQKNQEIMKELHEIDEGIKVFSNTIVYIRD